MQAVPLPPRTVRCRHAGKDFSREKAMKRFLTFLTAAFAAVLVCATMAPGAEVKTDYFTLNLPEGWIQPRSPQVPEGGLMVIVQNPAEQSAVSIAVTPAAKAPVTAEQSATAQAGFAKPCHVTHPNSRQKTHESIVHSG